MASGKCDLCPKRTRFGRNIRHKHSGRWERKAQRTNREFRPNVHKKRLLIDGRWRRVNVCTRCRYRSTELLWQCPQCHEWNTFVEERLPQAENVEGTPA